MSATRARSAFGEEPALDCQRQRDTRSMAPRVPLSPGVRYLGARTRRRFILLGVVVTLAAPCLWMFQAADFWTPKRVVWANLAEDGSIAGVYDQIDGELVGSWSGGGARTGVYRNSLCPEPRWVIDFLRGCGVNVQSRLMLTESSRVVRGERWVEFGDPDVVVQRMLDSANALGLKIVDDSKVDDRTRTK